MLLVFWHMVGETILQNVSGGAKPDLGGYHLAPFFFHFKKNTLNVLSWKQLFLSQTAVTTF